MHPSSDARNAEQIAIRRTVLRAAERGTRPTQRSQLRKHFPGTFAEPHASDKHHRLHSRSPRIYAGPAGSAAGCGRVRWRRKILPKTDVLERDLVATHCRHLIPSHLPGNRMPPEGARGDIPPHAATPTRAVTPSRACLQVPARPILSRLRPPQVLVEPGHITLMGDRAHVRLAEHSERGPQALTW